MKIANYFSYLALASIFLSCSNRSSKPVVLLKTERQKKIKVKIIDSIMIRGSINGFNEYIPLALSPSKEKLLLMKTRGGKDFFVVNLQKKSTKTYSIEEYPELNIGKVGIYNVTFVSDTIVTIFYKNVMSLLNLKNRKIVSQSILPRGYYSSYTKKAITFIVPGDTLYLSQLYSPKSSKYSNETDGFYDLCPLSVYSTKRNSFLCIYLPESSKFKTKNLGQPIVNFTRSGDTVYFCVSPESKIYSFIFNPATFQVTDFKTFSFNYSTGDTILSMKKSNFMKDMYRITTKNPYLSNIVKFNDKLLLSFSNGLSEKQYIHLYSNKLTEKERADFYSAKRRSYEEILCLNKKHNFGHTILEKTIESIALKITDSTYLLKPKIASYIQDSVVPIYIAKLKMDKNG